ncbi:class I SAM-dependent methyltransferase [Planctomycetota bacterium]
MCSDTAGAVPDACWGRHSVAGYRIVGTDLSPGAVARATEEAVRRGLNIEFGVRDVRSGPPSMSVPFDAVVSADNALPHLLTDRDIRDALHSMAEALRPGGVVLIGIRDYDTLSAQKPSGTTPGMRSTAEGRVVVVQAWEWADDGRSYDVHLFVLREVKDGWHVSEHTMKYRALLRAELSGLLAEAGFRDVEWIMPERSGLYQPLVVGFRA